MRLAFDKETCQKFAVKAISKKTFSVGVRDMRCDGATLLWFICGMSPVACAGACCSRGGQNPESRSARESVG